MATVLAVLAVVVLFGGFVWLIQLALAREPLAETDWSSDRRLWGPVSITSGLAWIAAATGGLDVLASSDTAEFTSLLLAIAATTVWVTRDVATASVADGQVGLAASK